jgi:hypothetical protein
MRRSVPLLLVLCLCLAACGGGSSTPTPKATDTPDPNATRTNTRTPHSTRTATQTGGPTHTPTRTGGPTNTPRPTKTPGPPVTLYVRQSGSDGNSGLSPDNALKTIGEAVNLLTPGSTLYVGRGTYNESVQLTRIIGTADQPVQVIADRFGSHTTDTVGDVIIDADDSKSFAVLVTESPYLTFDGFFLRGLPAVNGGVMLRARSTSDHFTVRNCVIANAALADGIRIDNSASALVFNNLVYGADRGIVVSGGSNSTRIINNTVALTARAGISLAARDSVSPSGVSLLNNIVQAADAGTDIDATGAGAGYVGDYNLVFQPDATDQTTAYKPASARGDHDINRDASFVNVDVGDLHLNGDSPAINASAVRLDSSLQQILLLRTTTADNALDRPPIDLGYHYPR